MRSTRATLLAGAALALGLTTGTTAADSIAWDGSQPPPGVYFYWYEPSFYTGFAPRTQDRSRSHLELGRGNQQRFTLVLGPDELDAYLDNLLQKQAIVQEMVDKGVIELTTNQEFDRYVAALAEAGVAEATASKGQLAPEAYRAKTVEIMRRLNPDRVFEIRIPVARVVGDWHAALSTAGDKALGSTSARLDAVNAVLPGRVNRYELEPALETALQKAVELVKAGKPATDPAFRQQSLEVLALATGGHYPVVGDQIEAVEFTAIYPAGTAKAWTTVNGEKLPDFGVTGVWTLTPRVHGRGVLGMVDYLSNNPGYGFIPLLGSQYAGGIAYNALHNAGVRSQLNATPFLPKEWRSVAGERTPGKAYQNLWIGSRGPASHGCTRLPSGHMSELRDALPSTSERLEGTPNFRNLPQCYDVFDIDGDGRQEVMGVQYYLAFWGEKHIPKAAYAPNDRKGFYAWLYKDNVAYRPDGSAVIKEVPVCRFVGLHKAEQSQVLKDVPLYEAPYARESIQFYKVKGASADSARGFELNRELRRVGQGYTLDRGALLLD
jgi:hypothetical protein